MKPLSHCILCKGASNLSLIYYHREHGEPEISRQLLSAFGDSKKKKYFILEGLPITAVVEDPNLVS